MHATLALHAHDRASIDGIPVTSVARTLLDLAELVPPTQLKRAYEQAERLRVLDVRSIRQLLERSNGRREKAQRMMIAILNWRSIGRSATVILRAARAISSSVSRLSSYRNSLPTFFSASC